MNFNAAILILFVPVYCTQRVRALARSFVECNGTKFWAARVVGCKPALFVHFFRRRSSFSSFKSIIQTYQLPFQSTWYGLIFLKLPQSGVLSQLNTIVVLKSFFSGFSNSSSEQI